MYNVPILINVFLYEKSKTIAQRKCVFFNFDDYFFKKKTAINKKAEINKSHIKKHNKNCN